MKIVLVSHYYPPHVGGMELVAFYQAKYLAEQGHSVTVVTSKVGADERSGSVQGIEIVRVRALNILEKKWGVPFPIFSPYLLFVMMRVVKRADIVHIHDAFYISSFIAALCARLCSKPIILMQHVEMVGHPSALVRGAQRLVYASTGAYVFHVSNRILTLNDRVDVFLHKRGVPHTKLVSFANGVDTVLFRPPEGEEKKKLRAKFRLPDDKKVVLFVGRFVPKKGFDKLLQIKNPSYQLVFCGGERPASAPPHAVFLGSLPHEKTAEVYRAADLFVLPSVGEGFPLSVQEAMASGLPVITTNDSGYKRYTLDPTLLSLVDTSTTAGVEAAINMILEDEYRMKAMSTYSRQYAVSNFSWPHVIDQLGALYRTVQLHPKL